MINLSKSRLPSPLIQTVPVDPGTKWVPDTTIVIDAPPDDDCNPLPEAQWSAQAVRTGICGSVAPRVITLPDGRYRMYYTQILPRAGFPNGANDYDNASTRILSAISTDGQTWTPEPGVRLSPQDGGAGHFRVVCGDVVPADEDQLRMYYEACPGTQQEANALRSAISNDGGLTWMPEPGDRLTNGQATYSSARIVFLEDGRIRLYCGEMRRGMISAISNDGGLTFEPEDGLRIPPGGLCDFTTAFAPEIIRLTEGHYLMYYAAYRTPKRAYILSATSDDGLIWHPHPEPIISPVPNTWGAAKCSEMCIFQLPQQSGEAPRYRMVYEACDGTTSDERGVWRIVGATV
ncbi:MAG: exo-alpha-sialidase [Chloroflexota bacterium]